MDISTILKPEAVRYFPAATSKKRLFQCIADLAQTIYGLPGLDVTEALLERESLGPTGIGGGVAVPHARVAGLGQVVGIAGILEIPLAFDAPDRLPVDIVFALLAPGNAAGEHLKALALVSRTLRDRTRCKKLRANSDPVALHAILTDGRTDRTV